MCRSLEVDRHGVREVVGAPQVSIPRLEVPSVAGLDCYWWVHWYVREIDLDEPSQSKILTFIKKGDDDPDQAARSSHETTRRVEHAAFAAWIKACCIDATLREAAKLNSDDYAKPQRPEAVIRHALKSRVADTFIRHVWSHRMRCFPCHTPHEFDEENHYEEYHRDYGDRMHIFRETPAASLQYLVEASRTTAKERLPLINLVDPRKSLFVLKPTSDQPKQDDEGKLLEAPSSVEPVTHVGGLKIDVDDYRYKSFVAWIQDYARTVGDGYPSADDLPADNWYPTDYFVRIRRGPKDWEEDVRLQLFGKTNGVQNGFLLLHLKRNVQTKG